MDTIVDALSFVMRLVLIAIVVASCSSDDKTSTRTPSPEPSPAAAPDDARITAAPPELTADAAGAPEPAADALVDIHSLDPSIQLDIRYATENNFTEKVVYPVARCRLRYDVARRLVAVDEALKADGYALKIWDCYRPISVQQKFWELVPDPRYVARPVVEDGTPVKGSKHNRGAAVDLTLVTTDGEPVEMPTDYDDFSENAHSDYAGATDAAKRHRTILREAMEAQGFSALPTEWWHFDGPNWKSYPLSDEPL